MELIKDVIEKRASGDTRPPRRVSLRFDSEISSELSLDSANVPETERISFAFVSRGIASTSMDVVWRYGATPDQTEVIYRWALSEGREIFDIGLINGSSVSSISNSGLRVPSDRRSFNAFIQVMPTYHLAG